MVPASPPPTPAAPRPGRRLEIHVPAPVGPADADRLCARLRDLLLASGAEVAVLDVRALRRPDAGTVDALARVLLAARRLGRTVRLRRASPRLLELLALLGLTDVLVCEADRSANGVASSGVESQRQPEAREQVGGVEERVERQDLPVDDLEDL